MADEALDKSPYPAIDLFVEFLEFSKMGFGGTRTRHFKSIRTVSVTWLNHGFQYFGMELETVSISP